MHLATTTWNLCLPPLRVNRIECAASHRPRSILWAAERPGLPHASHKPMRLEGGEGQEDEEDSISQLMMITKCFVFLCIRSPLLFSWIQCVECIDRIRCSAIFRTSIERRPNNLFNKTNVCRIKGVPFVTTLDLCSQRQPPSQVSASVIPSAQLSGNSQQNGLLPLSQMANLMGARMCLAVEPKVNQKQTTNCQRRWIRRLCRRLPQLQRKTPKQLSHPTRQQKKRSTGKVKIH